jgi:hypothetical protein
VSGVDDYTLSFLENLEINAIESEKELPSGEVLLELEAEASCEFDVSAHPSEILAEVGYFVDEHGMGTASKSVGLSITATLDREWTKVTSLEITSMNEYL